MGPPRTSWRANASYESYKGPKSKPNQAKSNQNQAESKSNQAESKSNQVKSKSNPNPAKSKSKSDPNQRLIKSWEILERSYEEILGGPRTSFRSS